MSSRFAPTMLLAGLAGCSAQQYAQEYDQDPFPALSDLALHGRQLNAGVGMRDFGDAEFGRLDQPIVLSLDYCEPMGLDTLRLEGGAHYTYDEADGTSSGQDVR